ALRVRDLRSGAADAAARHLARRLQHDVPTRGLRAPPLRRVVRRLRARRGRRLLVPRLEDASPRADAGGAPRASRLARRARAPRRARRDGRREPPPLRAEEPARDAPHVALLRVERGRRAADAREGRSRRARRTASGLPPHPPHAPPGARRAAGRGGAVMTPPLASVIVPAYNAAHTIGDCLEALLALDYPSDRLEIIAVDNRSTDGTAGVMRRYPVRVVSEPHQQSSYAARNTGLVAARGSVMLFTDADCLPDPGWARALVAALDDDDAGGAAGRIEAAPGTTLVERFQVDEHVLDAASAFTRPALPFAQTANAAYRRAVFERVGLFDPNLVSGGDLDLSWRMQRAGWGLAYAPGAIVRHRHRTT